MSATLAGKLGGGAVGSSRDIFVMKLAPDGTPLYTTYVGGAGADESWQIGVNASGEAAVAGWTQSGDYPKTLGSGRQGPEDAVAFQLNATGTGLVWSRYLGGSSDDKARGMTMDAAGNVYVVGETKSANFPVLNAAQGTFGGNRDGFLTKLDPTGSMAYSTFIGGMR
jgi:hypothetical protein